MKTAGEREDEAVPDDLIAQDLLGGFGKQLPADKRHSDGTKSKFGTRVARRQTTNYIPIAF